MAEHRIIHRHKLDQRQHQRQRYGGMAVESAHAGIVVSDFKHLATQKQYHTDAPKYDTVFNYTQKTGGVDIKSAYHQKSNYKRHIQGEVSKKAEFIVSHIYYEGIIDGLTFPAFHHQLDIGDGANNN